MFYVIIKKLQFTTWIELLNERITFSLLLKSVEPLTVDCLILEDASYLRLRQLQIGYTLPSEVASKAGLSRARIYLQGVNLFTLTGYSGLDPAISDFGDTAIGVDEGNYPAITQYIVGLNLSF